MSTLPRIPIARPDLGSAERSNVLNALDNNWITQGPFVKLAEKKLCEITGRKFAICCSSGTTALIAALMAAKQMFSAGNPLRIGVPTMTFAAVWNAIELMQCETLYLGCDLDTWQTPLSEWKRYVHWCQAFIAAPCYGMIGAMIGLETFCKETETILIEDAAESFTGSIGSRQAGSFGTVSCISFFGNKICTSAEGGACLTDDEELAMKIRLFINHGIAAKDYRRGSRPGINGRLTDVHAAILVAQLDRIPEMLNRRYKIFNTYCAAARDNGWEMPQPLKGEIQAPWLWAGIPPPRKIVNDTLAVAAEKLNIETRPVFQCGHNYDNGCQLRRNAEKISRTGIVLPLSSAMSDEEVDRVCQLIKSV